jgi:uncharacterized protein with GYD domain
MLCTAGDDRLPSAGVLMPKFLVTAKYTAEGLQGLAKDRASGRKTAVAQACKKAGGKLEAMYYCLGENDVMLILDMPDAVTMASVGAAVGATGLVRTATTTLLTVEEMDEALGKTISYRAPGA